MVTYQVACHTCNHPSTQPPLRRIRRVGVTSAGNYNIYHESLKQYVQTKRLVDVLGHGDGSFERSEATLEDPLAFSAPEQALLCSTCLSLFAMCFSTKAFRVYLSVSRYRLLAIRSLCGDPDGLFCPGGKLVQISLSRSVTYA